MTSAKPTVSPLRQRMLDDMRMRKFGEKTQADYVRAVRNFTKYLGRSPDTARVEDLRNYQLHLVDHGISPASLNSAISGLKFLAKCKLRLEFQISGCSVGLPARSVLVETDAETSISQTAYLVGNCTNRPRPVQGHVNSSSAAPQSMGRKRRRDARRTLSPALTAPPPSA